MLEWSISPREYWLRIVHDIPVPSPSQLVCVDEDGDLYNVSRERRVPAVSGGAAAVRSRL